MGLSIVINFTCDYCGVVIPGEAKLCFDPWNKLYLKFDKPKDWVARKKRTESVSDLLTPDFESKYKCENCLKTEEVING
jgi:hypothetical protein